MTSRGAPTKRLVRLATIILSGTDPHGQWTATAAAKIIDTEGSYWEFSYRVTMNNRTSEEQEYTVKIYFVDADGFSLDYTYAVRYVSITLRHFGE